MERWSGKVALVTGASAGIGAAVVEQLVLDGLKVVGLARRVERIEEIKVKLKGAKGELFPYKGDVAKTEDVEAVFRWIKEKFGGIHVLVNNAGIARHGTILTDGKLEHFKDVINVNLIGLISCTQQALRLMKATGVDDGHIILINSVAGHGIPKFPFPIFNVYPATKHGVTAFTEVVRQELAYFKSHIKITSLSPGAVETEINEASTEASGQGVEPPEELTKIIEEMPILKPKDIADAVRYVLQTPPNVQINELIIRPVGESV